MPPPCITLLLPEHLLRETLTPLLLYGFFCNDPLDNHHTYAVVHRADLCASYGATVGDTKPLLDSAVSSSTSKTLTLIATWGLTLKRAWTAVHALDSHKISSNIWVISVADGGCGRRMISAVQAAPSSSPMPSRGRGTRYSSPSCSYQPPTDVAYGCDILVAVVFYPSLNFLECLHALSLEELSLANPLFNLTIWMSTHSSGDLLCSKSGPRVEKGLQGKKLLSELLSDEKKPCALCSHLSPLHPISRSLHLPTIPSLLVRARRWSIAMQTLKFWRKRRAAGACLAPHCTPCTRVLFGSISFLAEEVADAFLGILFFFFLFPYLLSLLDSTPYFPATLPLSSVPPLLRFVLPDSQAVRGCLMHGAESLLSATARTIEGALLIVDIFGQRFSCTSFARALTRMFQTSNSLLFLAASHSMVPACSVLLPILSLVCATFGLSTSLGCCGSFLSLATFSLSVLHIYAASIWSLHLSFLLAVWRLLRGLLHVRSG